VESVQKMEVPDAVAPNANKIDDITAIDMELASCCYSEDEEIVEWEVLIGNGLGGN